MKQRKHINSVLKPDEFAKFYSGIMSKDDSSLNNSQKHIKDVVHARFRDFKSNAAHKSFSTDDIRIAISALRKNVSPGTDGIQAEHLIHGNCDELVSHLAVTYNSMFSHTVTPDILSIGIIIPILKKPTLNPNKPDNYRPITLSPTHIKLIEILMMPSDKSCNSQYGFRQGRGTAMACSLINDLMLYCNARGSPMFICSLDAEKCFDSIWHDGLFYKLIEILPLSHWLFLYQLYGSLQATVRWDGGISAYFRVTRGTKQGSILSPVLFNIFINDLLQELTSSDLGIKIGSSTFNSFAYADDVTLLSLCCKDLQLLIDLCESYAFGINKTKCIIAGRMPFKSPPKWKLGGKLIQNVEEIEILGTVFSSNLSYASNTGKRTQACRKAMYSLVGVGCTYPGGLSSDAKTYLWKSVGLPSLLYNLESTSISDICMRQVEKAQSSTVKRLLGFPQRSHHSNILRALNLSKVQSRIDKATLSLWYRIFQVDSPTRLLCAKLLSDFVLYGYSVPGTLIDRIIKMKLSPVKCLFRRVLPNVIEEAHHDGVVESLRFLILHENFIKPYSSEHIIASLLTKAFWTRRVTSLMVYADGPLVEICGSAACAIGCAACHPRPSGLTSQGWVAVGCTVADPVVGHWAHCDGRWYWVFGFGAAQLPGFAINWWHGRTAGRLHLRGLSHV